MNNIKNTTILGLFTAIIIVLANTIGFIQVGPLAITIMHIPVIIGAILYGEKFGAVIGLIFGLISMFRAYTQPSPTSFLMMNPLISVLPRVSFGYLTGLIYNGLKNAYEEKYKTILSIFLSISLIGATISIFILEEGSRYLGILLAIISLIMLIYLRKSNSKELVVNQITALGATGIHSILVLGMIYIIYAQRYIETLGKAVDVIVLGSSVNMIFEMIFSAIIVPPLIYALKKGK